MATPVRTLAAALLLATALLGAVACCAAPGPLVPAPPPLPAGETFRGRVVAGAEEDVPAPVAGAPVRWLLDLRPARTAAMALRTSGEGRTDADGRFALPMPPVAEGTFSLWCGTPSGWCLLETGLWFEEDNQWEQDEDYALRERDRPWRVRVVDAAGAPVGGARVDLVLGAEGAPIGPMRPGAVTDARGFAEFHGLETDNYWADISAPGFAPVRMCTHQFSEPLEEGLFDEYVLPEGRRLTGTVRAEPGGVPPDVELRLGFDSGRGGTAWCLPVGGDGRFELTVPAAGAARLRVHAAGFRSSEVHAEGLVDVVLELRPGEDDE